VAATPAGQQHGSAEAIVIFLFSSFTLPCVLEGDARQSSHRCRAFSRQAQANAHRRRSDHLRRECLYFAVRLPWRTAIILFHAFSRRAHSKAPLPCKILLCAICCASNEKCMAKGLPCVFSSLLCVWDTRQSVGFLLCECKHCTTKLRRIIVLSR
jgi:hypothetical protein